MTDHECPICFLHYSQVNVTQCCQADICTECYLQVRPQKERTSICPFCNHPKMCIKVAKTMDSAAVEERQMNEQKVIEAKIRAQNSSVNEDPSGFGSSLEHNTAVRLMRARSESLSSAGDSENDVASIAMTPEDRQVLEEEIRAQHLHPLARRVEQEAEDRRLENERNYYRSQSGRLRELRMAEMRARSARMARMSSDPLLLGGRRISNNRNWNEIVDAFENGGNGEVNTLDDLVVLEAAILLSMAEEGRRREEESGSSTADNNEASNPRFDAAQHAMQGFPLVHSLLADPAAAVDHRPSSSRRGRSLRSLQHGSHDMSNLLLAGISEAEQIEMAIAMSLQQAQQQRSTSNDEAAESQETTAETGASSRVEELPRSERIDEAEQSSRHSFRGPDNASNRSEQGNDESGPVSVSSGEVGSNTYISECVNDSHADQMKQVAEMSNARDAFGDIHNSAIASVGETVQEIATASGDTSAASLAASQANAGDVAAASGTVNEVDAGQDENSDENRETIAA